MNTFLDNLVRNDTFPTVISGTIVFILGQLFVEFYIRPLRDYKTIKQKIFYTLSLYKSYYNKPYNSLNIESNIRDKSEYMEARKELRKIGSELSGYLANISDFKKKYKKRLNKVVEAIIGISNGLFIFDEYNPINDTIKYEEIIENNLK